jgi:hypothetical protein
MGDETTVNVERYLHELARRDEEIGARVEARVSARYGSDGSLEGYRFDDSFAKQDQATHRVGWVHEDRYRAARFVYRHLPRPVRYGLKRLLG